MSKYLLPNYLNLDLRSFENITSLVLKRTFTSFEFQYSDSLISLINKNNIVLPFKLIVMTKSILIFLLVCSLFACDIGTVDMEKVNLEIENRIKNEKLKELLNAQN